MLITPRDAARLLATVPDSNRWRWKVDNYANAMTRGLWRPGSVIEIFPYGRLRDGAYQLTACVESGVSPRTVRGSRQVCTVCASSKSAYLSRNEARGTDDGARHEDDRQAEEPSERDDEQRDHCDNEPLLCIRHRCQLIN